MMKRESPKFIQEGVNDQPVLLLNPFEALRRLGVMLVMDDAKDVPRFDRVHHWHWGAIFYLLSIPLELYFKSMLPVSRSES